jgi:hypothetical protein
LNLAHDGSGVKADHQFDPEDSGIIKTHMLSLYEWPCLITYREADGDLFDFTPLN